MSAERRRIFTIGAWAPALRSLLNSTVAECGCVIGVYQVWNGGPLAVVDLPSKHCVHGHRNREQVPTPALEYSASALQRS